VAQRVLQKSSAACIRDGCVVLFTNDDLCPHATGDELREQPPEVRGRLGTIRRRRVLLGAIGAAGLVAGILYWAVQPTMPSATAQVLLPVYGAGSSVPSSEAQEAVATSPEVLNRATHSVVPPISGSLLRKRVKVTTIGDNVLSIRVKDGNPAHAVALADAVAKAYIAVAPQYFGAALQTQLANNQEQEIINVERIPILLQDMKMNGPASATGTIDQSEIDSLQTTISALEANDTVLRGELSAVSPVLLQQAGAS
jgi:hypothetical protein